MTVTYNHLPPHLEELLKKIKSSSSGKRALATLTGSKGVDQMILLEALYRYLYRSGEQKEKESLTPGRYRQQCNIVASEAWALAAKVAELKRLRAEATEESHSLGPNQLAADLVFDDSPIPIPIPILDRLEEDLLAVADFRADQPYARKVESKRSRNLAYLINLVRSAKGSPHYINLAKLINAAQPEPDRMPDNFADAIRNTANRLKRNHRRDYLLIARVAQAHLAYGNSAVPVFVLVIIVIPRDC
jgi:hypothetical protein